VGIDRVDVERMFPLVGESRTGNGGHCLKIRGDPFKREMRRNVFTRRVLSLLLRRQWKQNLAIFLMQSWIDS